MSVIVKLCEWALEKFVDLMPVFIVAIILGMVFGIGAIIYDAYTWPDYAAEHGCKPANVAKETKGVICSGDPVICTPTTDSKELWVCENGERHWRSF